MKVTGRDRRTLAWGGVVAALILLWAAAIDPLLSRWERTGREIQRARREVERLERGATAEQQARQALRELEVLAWVHQDEGSLQRQTALLIQQLAGLPAYQRLTIRQVQGQPPQREPSIARAQVSLQFRGHPVQVQRLLEEMEAARPRLLVEGLTLRPSRENAEVVEGEMQISVCAVVLKGEPA
ncbi:MAG: type II secretion system protein M [Armatimonadetes bacterium]|nr:type II secretion system protein M [Armatimonadota bacterium]